MYYKKRTYFLSKSKEKRKILAVANNHYRMESQYMSKNDVNEVVHICYCKKSSKKLLYMCRNPHGPVWVNSFKPLLDISMPLKQFKFSLWQEIHLNFTCHFVWVIQYKEGCLVLPNKTGNTWLFIKIRPNLPSIFLSLFKLQT